MRQRNHGAAIRRALDDISRLQRDQHINAQVARRGREVVGLIFRPNTVYASIGPVDGGDLSFYWKAGTRAIHIDIYEHGGLWCAATDSSGQHTTHHGQGLPQWMWNALADCTKAVEEANPNWVEQPQ